MSHGKPSWSSLVASRCFLTASQKFAWDIWLKTPLVEQSSIPSFSPAQYAVTSLLLHFWPKVSIAPNPVKGDTVNPFLPLDFGTCWYHEKSNQHDHGHCQVGPKIGEAVIKVVGFEAIVIRSWWYGLPQMYQKRPLSWSFIISNNCWWKKSCTTWDVIL